MYFLICFAPQSCEGGREGIILPMWYSHYFTHSTAAWGQELSGGEKGLASALTEHRLMGEADVQGTRTSKSQKVTSGS